MSPRAAATTAAKAGKNPSSGYDAAQLTALKGLEPVRKRPGMYIGSTDVRGLHHLVYEIVDNAVDESLAGHCTHIVVTLHSDGSVSVRDNGRGIPVDIHPTEKVSGLELVMTTLHAGGKFNEADGAYRVSGGLHGVGASVVNALSERMMAEVSRGGHLHRQTYSRGLADGPLTRAGKTTARGTYIRFWPDPEIFPEREFSASTLIERFREMAFLNKGLAISALDERNDDARTFYFEGGIAAFVRYLNDGKAAVGKVFYIEKEVDSTTVEIALQYQNTVFSEHLLSFANNIHTPEGGTHVTGFRGALTATLNKYARKACLLKEADANLTGEDVRDGLCAVISVKVLEPQFEGQTKSKLGSSEVTGRVSSVFSEAFAQFLDENPAESRKIIDLCLQSSRARAAAARAREMVQRKSLLESTTLPGKLTDCSEKDPSKCELFIVEGDSAGGSAKMGRERRTQAILPLKGKIINVEKSRVDKVLANEEIRNLITAMGMGYGDALDIAKLRYHRIVLMVDADVDGSHIRTLLLTFFWRHLRAVIDAGHLFLAQPPLYQVKKGKVAHWAFSDAQRDARIAELSGAAGKLEVQRYKGLGEMNPEQLWTTTMDPATRTLLQVKVDDAIRADDIFDRLMGVEVAPRKRFIQTHARSVRNLDV